MRSETWQDRTVASGSVGSAARAGRSQETGGGAKARVLALGATLLAVAVLAGCGAGPEGGDTRTTRNESAQGREAGARVALVIGNAKYESSDIGRLENPVRDAERVAEALDAAGFEVVIESNLKYRPFHHALGAFAEKSRRAATAAFYYAGHGMEQGGVNYLVPVDMKEPTHLHNAVELDEVMRSMQGERNLVFLDACRTLPGRGLRGASDSPLSRGLVAVPTKKGQQVVISYAAAAGKPALDGEAGGNSPYAAALAAHLVTPGQRLVDLLIEVENTVLEATDGQQEPWPSGSLGEKFYFVPPEPDIVVVDPTEDPVVVNPPPPPVVPSWKTDWERLEGIKDPARAGTVRAYIEMYEDEPLAAVWVTDAKSLLAELTKPPPPPLPEPSGSGQGGTGGGTRPSRPVVGSSWKSPLGMEFVWIPAGRFLMGSPKGEEGRDGDEVQHEVRISRGYWLGKYEVTQGEWEAVMGGNPSYFRSCGSRCPVERVSWDDIQEFMRKLNERESRSGNKYRLPSEAEWEYAARAGTAGLRYGELGEIAWYGGNSGDRTHPVGQKRANGWGLHDMLGNVWEWTADRYGGYPSGLVTDPRGPSTGSFRVGRGGGWGDGARIVRSAYRNTGSPGIRYYSIGFRLVRTE